MCFSEKATIVSLASFIVSSTAVYIYVNKTVGIIMFFIGLMQVYDLIFWRNQTENKINHLFTKLAIITNHLQPVVLALLIIFVEKRKLAPLSLVFLLTYMVSIALYTARIWKEVNYTLPNCKRSSCTLFWQWNYGPYSLQVYILFLLTVMLLFLQHFAWPLNLISALYTVASFFIVLFAVKGNTLGRFWCWSAGFIPIFILLTTKLIQ